MFVRIPSVGMADICGCMWSWSWDHNNPLNIGQQCLTKINTKQVACEQVFSMCIMYGSSRILIFLHRRSVANNF
jgi:hypothetical protein